MHRRDDISLIDMKFVEKSVDKREIMPKLVVGDLWSFDTNGQKNNCGATYAPKLKTMSLLRDKKNP